MANPSSDKFTALVRSNRSNRDSALLRATTELFATDMDHSADEIRQYEELATHLIPKVHEPDRIFVSGQLASIGDAPISVLRALARDTLAVAAPILKNSPALSPFDLLCIIAGTGPDHHRLIAKRSPLPDDVKRALLLTADSAPGTGDRHAEHRKAAETRSPQAATRNPLKGGWDFLRLDRSERRQAVARLAEAPPPPDNPGTSEPRAAFQKIASTAQIIGFARGGQVSDMIGAMSDALDLPSDFIAASVNDQTGEPLAVLLRALRLDNATAQQVILLTSPVGRDTAAFFPLTDFHAGMEHYVAEGMILAWRRTKASAVRHEPVLQDTARPRAERVHQRTDGSQRHSTAAASADQAKRA
jgi:hypothetical protein